MEKNSKRLILLVSLVLVVIPMVIFPSRLGMPLLTASAIYILYEVVFYGIVLYFFRRSVALTALLMGAAITLVFRLCLGAVFGTTIILMYGLESSVAFSLGMTRYLPALILQVLAVPFVIKPVYLTLADAMSGSAKLAKPTYSASTIAPGIVDADITDKTKEPQMPITSFEPAVSAPDFTPMESVGSSPPLDDTSALSKAVSYIGELASIKMALLVDDEGLTLARFNRSKEDYELWGPLALILEKENRTIVNKYSRLGAPTKIDIMTRQNRLIIRRIDYVTLMVMADDSIDETIHIRIAQATDMIRKYMSERYSPALFARAEERYVSNS
ncbi:MAG: hypothetical protein KAR42_01840 [candidate division Zixibacteria bacterium]|nr:hypothetical protein [candidate division Zixibacteria bacterium]